MYAHLLEGVQTTGEGCVSAWLTITTDFQVYVDAGDAIAFGEADMDGEFELVELLTSEVELMVNAINAKRSLSKRIRRRTRAASGGCRRSCVIANASSTKSCGW